MKKCSQILLLTLALLLIVSSIAVAATPDFIYYKNAAGDVVKADAKVMVSNQAMKAAFRAAQNSGRDIIVVEGNKIISWSAAIRDGVSYPQALNTAKYQLTSAPAPTKELKPDGSETDINQPPVQFIKTLTATVDSFGFTRLNAEVNPEVTKIKVLKGTRLLQEAAAVNNAVSTYFLGAAAGDILTVEAYNSANSRVESKTVTVGAGQSNSTDFLTGANAKVDSFGFTKLTASVHSTVTKVKVLKGTTLLQEVTPANNAVNTNFLGASVNDVLSLEVYVGNSKVKTVPVTVASATPSQPEQYITNQRAVFDNLIITTITANVNPLVTKVEVIQGNRVVETITVFPQGKINTTTIGAPKNSVIALKPYIGSVAKPEVTITVE